jgi:hydroxymethylglutaryl-CoA lyase/(R)-citramalyl-CoA lyase
MATTRARDHQLFSGKLDRAELGLAERALTGALHVPSGDYREWDAVTAWATAIARTLETATDALGRKLEVIRIPSAGLVLNDRGYERAVAAGVDEVHYAFAATDEFGRRNQNATTEEGLRTALALVARARSERVPITVTLSVAFGCPFEGPVPAERVLRIVEHLMEIPPDEICLADTIGVGVPSQVKELVGGARALGASVGAHFHNTRNTGYANAVAALDEGVVSLDASVGGAGGCPFAPKATGNIATEDLVYLLRGLGVDTGVDLDALIGTSQWLAGRLGKELPGMVARAGDFPSKA